MEGGSPQKFAEFWDVFFCCWIFWPPKFTVPAGENLPIGYLLFDRYVCLDGYCLIDVLDVFFLSSSLRGETTNQQTRTRQSLCLGMAFCLRAG